jgi:hypothetical protein
MRTLRHITEQIRAELPDGRTLLLERGRAPRLGRAGELVLSLTLLIGAILLLPLTPLLEMMLFAGLWSGVPLVFVYCGLAWMVWLRASDWARSPPNDPPGCRVIGVDVSTNELLGFMGIDPDAGLEPRTIH